MIFVENYFASLFLMFLRYLLLEFSKILCSVLKLVGPYRGVCMAVQEPPFLQSDWLI